MAWEKTKWACGHEGHINLFGKEASRQSRLAYEAGRKCFVCWLIEQWEAESDPRAMRPDKYRLAAGIAEGKGIRIADLPLEVPVENGSANEKFRLAVKEALTAGLTPEEMKKIIEQTQ